MKVTSIDKGIVIDHITSGKGLRIFEKLNLQDSQFPVVLLMNVPSKRFGTKDMIKIQGTTQIDLHLVGLIDPLVTINIIDGENSVLKQKIQLPHEVSGLFPCKNPRCITNHDIYATASFTLVDFDSLSYQCAFCEEITKYSID